MWRKRRGYSRVGPNVRAQDAKWRQSSTRSNAVCRTELLKFVPASAAGLACLSSLGAHCGGKECLPLLGGGTVRVRCHRRGRGRGRTGLFGSLSVHVQEFCRPVRTGTRGLCVSDCFEREKTQRDGGRRRGNWCPFALRSIWTLWLQTAIQ